MWRKPKQTDYSIYSKNSDKTLKKIMTKTLLVRVVYNHL